MLCVQLPFINISRVFSLAAARPGLFGALAGWFQQACGLGAALLLIPVVTRFLTPDQAGIWFSFQGLVTMIALLDLGFGFAIARQAAFTLGATETTTVKDDFIHLAHGWPGVGQLFLLTRTLYHWLALSAAVTAVLTFELFSHFGNLIPPESSGARWCWYAMASASVLLILTSGESAFLNGLGAVYQTRFLAGFYQLFAGAGAACAAWQGWGLPGMGMSFAICALLYKFTVALTRRAIISPLAGIQVPPPPPGSLGKLARAALPVGGVNVFGSLVYTIQAPMLGFLLGPEKVAPFYVAQKLGMACNLAAMQLVLPQLPFFTKLIGSCNIPGALSNMKRNLVRATILVLVSSVGFYFISPWIAAVLLKKSTYVDNYTLAVMAVDLFCLGASVIWGQYVLASGKNPFVLSTVLTGVMAMTLTILCALEFGVVGLPIATLMAGLCFNYRKCLNEGWKLKKALASTNS